MMACHCCSNFYDVTELETDFSVHADSTRELSLPPLKHTHTHTGFAHYILTLLVQWEI